MIGVDTSPRSIRGRCRMPPSRHQLEASALVSKAKQRVVAVDAHDALSSELLVPEAAASVLLRPLQLQLCRIIIIEHDNEDMNQ